MERPFGRGTTLFRGLTTVINHLLLKGMILQVCNNCKHQPVLFRIILGQPGGSEHLFLRCKFTPPNSQDASGIWTVEMGGSDSCQSEIILPSHALLLEVLLGDIQETILQRKEVEKVKKNTKSS